MYLFQDFAHLSCELTRTAGQHLHTTACTAFPTLTAGLQCFHVSVLCLLCRFTTPSSSAINMPTKTQQPISVSAGAGTAPTAVQPAEAKKTKGEHLQVVLTGTLRSCSLP